MKRHFDKVGTGVGFNRTQGKIRKRVTKEHSIEDVNKTFVDDYGKTYVYTSYGNIY